MQQTRTKNLVLWYVPALWMAIFIAASIAQMWSFSINDFDFNIFLTQIWRVWNGWDWHAPFTECYLGMPYWGEHCTPISALLAPLVGPWKSPYALSILQAVSTGLSAFILPRLVRVIYRQDGDGTDDNWIWTAGILLALFFVYRFTLAPWSRQVHYTTIVCPILLLAVYFLHQRRWVPVGICCLLVCLGQERAALGVFSLGMYAFLLLGMRRAGIVLCAASGLWFFTASQLWLPHALKISGSSVHYRFQQYITITGAWEKKLSYMFRLVAYSWFLPLLGKRAFLCLLCTAPFLGVVAISDYPTFWNMNGQYEDLPGVFLLISFCYAIKWLQAKLPALRQKQIFAVGTLGIVIIMFATQTGWYNPAATLIRFATSPQRPAYSSLHAAINALPEFPADVTVWAQSGLGPHVFYPYHRMTADMRRMKGELRNDVVLISPIAGTMRLGDDNGEKIDAGVYAQAKNFFDGHPDLKKIFESPVFVLYASRDILASNSDFSKKLQAYGSIHQ